MTHLRHRLDDHKVRQELEHVDLLLLANLQRDSDDVNSNDTISRSSPGDDDNPETP